jgi:hypothetical protein
MTRKGLILAAALSALLSSEVVAQAPAASVRIRGTIESVDGNTLNVAARDGQKVTVRLLPDARVSYPTRLDLTDIKPNDFVGVGWVRGPDGSARAVEVLVFPAAQRGTGEGERVWDLLPDSTMTNATVATAAATPEGPVLKLTHKDGTTEVKVPPAAPVWTPASGDRTLLKPGAYVVLTGQKQPDGTVQTASVAVEKDGFKPPN